MRATVALARLMRRIAPSSLPSPLKLKVNHQTINYQTKVTNLKTSLNEASPPPLPRSV